MTPTPPPSLRRELLGSFGLLFVGGILLASLGILLVFPLLRSPTEAAIYLFALLVGDLAILFLFGRRQLEGKLVEPVDRLVEDTERIAEGDYRHRVDIGESAELQALARSVNALADRLIREQERLAANIKSLERTNRELVEARNEVVRAARLASAGTLASGIAHEVGNPLSALFSYVDVTLKRAEASRGGGANVDPELLQAIREEANRIDRIVRGLLDYARPETGEGAAADPSDVVDDVIELLKEQGRLEGVAVEWERPNPRGPDVEGEVEGEHGGEAGGTDRSLVHMDPHRLEHVLMNLFLNSLDALEGRADPRIRVSLRTGEGGARRMPIRREGDPPGVNYAHRRRVALEQEGGTMDPLWTSARIVTLVVEDNGPGIPEDDLERVFDPFFTTKEPGQGTGLGLAVCARLVEGMGGEIDLENRQEGGARFTIRLPGVTGEAEFAETTSSGRSE
ncbi:MAG: sensor histidine kinase [Gemmatimonadota bacterium]